MPSVGIGLELSIILSYNKLSLGLSDKPVEKPGAADSRFFSVKGIPTIDFTAIGNGLHGPNEWVDLPSILTTAEFFTKTARELQNLD